MLIQTLCIHNIWSREDFCQHFGAVLEVSKHSSVSVFHACNDRRPARLHIAPRVANKAAAVDTHSSQPPIHKGREQEYCCVWRCSLLCFVFLILVISVQLQHPPPPALPYGALSCASKHCHHHPRSSHAVSSYFVSPQQQQHLALIYEKRALFITGFVGSQWS